MYDYKTQRKNVFTEGGQKLFLQIRDRTKALISKAGAARLQEMISSSTGDSWDMLACVDRMVELGEIQEVTDPRSTIGQHRIFTEA